MSGTSGDVASAPPSDRTDRRSVTGNVFIVEVAGATCDRMLDFDACERIARKVNEHTVTIGVVLAPCSLPHTCKANFALGADEMAVGSIALHHLDGELTDMLDHPCDCAMFRVG